MEFKDAVILITGGSLGIGKQTAKDLTEQGAKVIITGRNKERIEAAASSIGAYPLVADVSIEKDVLSTYEEILDKFGKLDCLINNAGIGIMKPLVEVQAEDMEQVWKTNVLGATLMAREAAKIFVKQDYGHIVNIASTAALRGYAGGSIYSSTKFALRSLSECWRAELRKNNVRVIQVNPSLVTTAFANPDRIERPEEEGKLTVREISHAIVSALAMDDRGFVPEVTIHATNPF